jgi:hypothetical protein
VSWGRRKLARSQKQPFHKRSLNDQPANEPDGGEPAFDVWLVSVTRTKFRLSPTTMHAEIARGLNTIFGLLKSDMDPKRRFAPHKVLVLYCRHEAATKPLHQAVEYSKLAMFRSRPICGCIESFSLC